MESLRKFLSQMVPNKRETFTVFFTGSFVTLLDFSATYVFSHSDEMFNNCFLTGIAWFFRSLSWFSDLECFSHLYLHIGHSILLVKLPSFCDHVLLNKMLNRKFYSLKRHFRENLNSLQFLIYFVFCTFRCYARDRLRFNTALHETQKYWNQTQGFQQVTASV